MADAEKSVYVDEEMVDPFDGDKRDFLIKAEHLERYNFAARLIRDSSKKAPVAYDMACGNGYGSKIMADAGAQVIGFDRHEQYLEKARSRTKATAQFVSVDLEDVNSLPAGLPPADFIVSFETLEHVADPKQLLTWMHTALAENGLLVCSIPNAVFEPKTEDGKPKNTFHKGLYSKVDAVALLQETGFNIEQLLGQPLPNIIVNHARFMSKPLDAIAFRHPKIFNLLSSVIARPTPRFIAQTYSHIFVARKT